MGQTVQAEVHGVLGGWAQEAFYYAERYQQV